MLIPKLHITRCLSQGRDIVPSAVGYFVLVTISLLLVMLVRHMFFTPSRPTIPEAPMESVLLPNKNVPVAFTQYKDPDFDLKKTMEELNQRQVPPDHKMLVNLIRNYYIEMPNYYPYQLDDPEDVNYFYGQTPYIDERLKYQNQGFFVEYRGFEGERESISLFFERYRKWGGIVIEPNPNLFEQLRKKKRKCFIMNACIHDQPYPAVVTFQTPDVKDPSVTHTGMYTIQCFPLLSVLLALRVQEVNLFTVNFFGINAHGNNRQRMIKNLPSDQVHFEFITVHDYLPRSGDTSTMETTMLSKNFELLGQLKTREPTVKDWVFHNKAMTIPNPVFWTWTNIFRAAFVFGIFYLAANVFVYQYYFKRTRIYKRNVLGQ